MNRWFRLASTVVAMAMIANLQYAWTLPSPRKSQRDSLVAAEVQEQAARG